MREKKKEKRMEKNGRGAAEITTDLKGWMDCLISTKII